MDSWASEALSRAPHSSAFFRPAPGRRFGAGASSDAAELVASEPDERETELCPRESLPRLPEAADWLVMAVASDPDVSVDL
mmetsp:Transcript_9128/g.23672  ORF Transcript_9128/g.23672 Transcript_9128/m.23672 type:complete len:81 (-) Transcript_9128:557-799(-)